MELEFLIRKLSFADGAPLAYPHATVAIRPMGHASLLGDAPCVALSFTLTDTVAPGASLQAIADAALSEARSMIQPAPVKAMLQRALDEEARRNRDNDAQLQSVLNTPPT